MELVIRLKNGQPVDHPILVSNLLQAFPDTDLSNLPNNDFARFERVEKREIGPYEIYESSNYEWSGNIVKDVHNIRQMTSQEKLDKQNLIKQMWADNPGWASWIFDEETAVFKPPVPYPSDGNPYMWDEAILSWKALQLPA